MFLLYLIASISFVNAAEEPARPNILWITCEDMSAKLGCYGDAYAHTPNLDRLAARGIRYTHAFATSGVCAPARSCLITGVYPSSLGTHFMRCRGELPEFIRCYPEYLRQAGYYCTNNSKTDYNFAHPRSTWDESSGRAHWRNRKPGQPFFAIFNNTDTHESKIRSRGAEFARLTARLTPEERHDPAKIKLPPYHADTPEARRDWANDYDLITAMDYQSGGILKQLEEDGLAEDTIVFFYSDHGVGLQRSKRWLYDSGMHVPLIVHFPKKYQHLAPLPPGSVTDRLVSFVDFAPTLLSLAGVTIPQHMQGVAFLGPKAGPPREYVYGIRDRMDERHDIIRAVRDTRYKYIRNYRPDLPYDQHLNYAEQGPTMQSMRALLAAGKLSGPPLKFFQPGKPAEELYDTQADPHEINNLAALPEHRATLERLRAAHLKWMDETIDLGLVPESHLRELTRSKTCYEIVRESGNPFPLARIREAALAAQGGAAAKGQLLRLLSDEDPAVRYWALVGLGTLKSEGADAEPAIRQALSDSSPTVRVAAGAALGKQDRHAPGLPVLVECLSDKNDWVRHAAMQALDDYGPHAASARPQIEAALKDTNDYVARIAQHFLAQREKAAGGE
jgi:uncharacterized sulfatase